MSYTKHDLVAVLSCCHNLSYLSIFISTDYLPFFHLLISHLYLKPLVGSAPPICISDVNLNIMKQNV